MFAREQQAFDTDITSDHHAPSSDARKDAALAFAVALIVRLFLLLLDANPRFFLGDSESYLFTARNVWIPSDRSWLYGFGINALIRVTHSLTSVVIVQSFCGAVVCATVALFCRALGVRRALCAVVLVVTSVEPLLLYYDRSIMTETLATLCIWAAVVCSALSISRPRARAWIGAAAIGCWGAISLRTALVPIVALLPVVLLVLAMVELIHDGRDGVRRDARRRVVGAIVLGALVATGSAAYAVATGKLTHSPAGLNPRGGYFLLGVTAPILAPIDFAGTGVHDPAALLDRTRHGDLSLRNAQVFADWGIALQLEADLGDWRAVANVGSTVARRAALRDPVGFGRLALFNTAEYVSPVAHRASFATQAGIDRALPDRTIELLRSRVSERITADSPAQPSIVLAWLRATTPALPGLVLMAMVLPVVALFATRAAAPPTRDTVMLLAVITWTHLLSVVALSPTVVPRYLLPLVPCTLTLAAVCGDRLLARGSAQARSG
jgi:hypothetical protein